VLMTFRNPVGYSAAWSLQQEFHAERLLGNRADTLMLLQHLPVYTAGRRQDRSIFIQRLLLLAILASPL
jgi:lipoate-protein ligase B